MSLPRVLMAGLRGGSGKTLLSLGLAAFWRREGLTVAPFKKGPDYIDAAWLALAAGRSCRNLDLFFHPPPILLASFHAGARGAQVAIIEGNRGLFDGMDARGSASSAELAKLLRAPVLLSVDVTKTTRTAAALVLGCQRLDPEVALGGVILNRTAGSRHESVLRRSIEESCGVPVLGAVPSLPEEIFPERHLGLVPPHEHEERERTLERVAKVAEEYLDTKRILELARSAPELGASTPGVAARKDRKATRPGGPGPAQPPGGSGASPPFRVGVFRDEAFQFYYPENLEALVREGAVLVEISPIHDPSLPEVDALYLGGGFPETLAVELSENRAFAASLREAAGEGLPVYAECGGAVYLGESLLYQGREFPMAGVLPVRYSFQEKPRGHGYVVVEAVEENPFFPVGETLRGHEFHYTYMVDPGPRELVFAFRVHRGYGFDGRRDGLIQGQVLASYTHLHALGTEGWAPSLVRAAASFRSRPGSPGAAGPPRER